MNKLIVLLLVILSSCSFKKSVGQKETQPPSIVLINSIKNDSKEKVLDSISSTSSELVKNVDVSYDAFYAALTRGDETIVAALIDKGFPLYASEHQIFLRKNSFEAFGPIDNLNQKVSHEIENSLLLNNSEALENLMLKYNVSCTSVLSLHFNRILIELATATIVPSKANVDLSTISERQDHLVKILSNKNDCEKALPSSPQRSRWLTFEILRAVYQKDGFEDDTMFNFLVALFPKNNFKFQYVGTEMVPIESLIQYRINNLQDTDESKISLRKNWLQQLDLISNQISKNLSDSDIEAVEATYLLPDNQIDPTPRYLKNRAL